MSKPKHQERRLLVVSKRRQPTDEGLARLVAAMVLHQLERENAAPSDSEHQPAAEDTA